MTYDDGGEDGDDGVGKNVDNGDGAPVMVMMHLYEVDAGETR